MNTVILHTRFWHDDFICGLTPKEKLLFLYLLSNEHVNIAGVYELPEQYIRATTGLRTQELHHSKQKLEAAGKFRFLDSWIRIVNYDKYQSYTSEPQKKGRDRIFKQAPKQLFEAISKGSGKGMGRVTKPYISYKYEIRKKKEEYKKTKDETVVVDNSADDIPTLAAALLSAWNEMHGTNFSASKPLEKNLAYWLEQYSKHDLLQAVANVRRHDYWKDKMTPTIFLRQKNPRSEEVDYIGELLNIDTKPRRRQKGGTAEI